MKNLIFLTCLYFQIFLVQCDIFVNNANGSDAKIKICIQKSINHLFSENETLSLILNNNNLCEDAIFEMNTMRQYIVLNMDVINGVNKLQYRGQFIICPKDLDSLNYAIHRTLLIARRNRRNMGSAKILVITNITDVSWMFYMFWYYGINNVIILVYGQRTSKLLTCNRFAPENSCGKTAKLIIEHDCEEQLSLSVTSVVRQMNKCPITFPILLPNSFFNDENHPITRTFQFIMVELSHRFNTTFQRTMCNNRREYLDWISKKQIIVILSGSDNFIQVTDVTEPLVRSDIVWLVPKAGRISNMNACLKVFNYDVWIATSVIFISTWLTWFLIISRNGGFTFDNLCISFLNVWSLTIFGNVAQLPRSISLALRILLFFYLIYAINMQFAFTSDMSTFLTAPRYEFQIRNLEQLADSQLPIYIYNDIKQIFFENNYTDRKLYSKLQNLIHVVTFKQYKQLLINLQLHRNYTVVAHRIEMLNIEFMLNKTIEAYEIMDNEITPISKNRFVLEKDHYFTHTLNTFLNEMMKSGISEKSKNGFLGEAVGKRNGDASSQEDFLTLKHLSFIFVFFGFGLCTACVVLCCELVLHKYL